MQHLAELCIWTGVRDISPLSILHPRRPDLSLVQLLPFQNWFQVKCKTLPHPFALHIHPATKRASSATVELLLLLLFGGGFLFVFLRHLSCHFKSAVDINGKLAQTQDCRWRGWVTEENTVTCVTWSPGSVDISLIFLAVGKAAEVTHFVSGPWYLQFSRYSPPPAFKTVTTWPASTAVLVSSFNPLAWHWSGAVFPRSAQWSWWKCFFGGVFLQEKGNLFWQTLNASCHYVTIPSEPVKKITMNGIWLHDHVAT